MMGNSHVTYKCLENAGKYGLETIEEIRSYFSKEKCGRPTDIFLFVSFFTSLIVIYLYLIEYNKEGDIKECQKFHCFMEYE